MSAKIDRPLVVLPIRKEPLLQADPAEKVPPIEANSQQLVFIDQICMMLFDRWCEQRHVLALAYLMRGWPLTGDDPSLVRRLLQSLHELGKYHEEELLSDDAALLGMLLISESRPAPA